MIETAKKGSRKPTTQSDIDHLYVTSEDFIIKQSPESKCFASNTEWLEVPQAKQKFKFNSPNDYD